MQHLPQRYFKQSSEGRQAGHAGHVLERPVSGLDALGCTDEDQRQGGNGSGRNDRAGPHAEPDHQEDDPGDRRDADQQCYLGTCKSRDRRMISGNDPRNRPQHGRQCEAGKRPQTCREHQQPVVGICGQSE
ncbi:hypothetical protein D3C87_1791100 [compost metagenome]